MNTRSLLSRLDVEWQALRQSWAGLPDTMMDEPGVVGAWSVKDLMSHVATWEDESIKALGLMTQGKRPPRYFGIDAFNARQAAAKAGLPLAEVRRQFEDTHRKVVALVSRMPEEHWASETRVRRRLRLDTYRHYREHCPQVLAWRKVKGL